MDTEKTPIPRSPRFPIYDLNKALEKVRALYTKHKKNYVHTGAALSAMGHKSGSSKGMQALATLGYFGLLDVMGSGNGKKVKVSDIAFKIFMDERPQSQEREDAIKETALNPKMFKLIYDLYQQELPGDDALKYELIHNHHFNEASVYDFIRVFRETMIFAKVYESVNMEEEEQGDSKLIPPDKEVKNMNISQKGKADAGTTKLPPPSKEDLLGVFPSRPNLAFKVMVLKDDGEINQNDIQQLIDYLGLYKKGIPGGSS